MAKRSDNFEVTAYKKFVSDIQKKVMDSKVTIIRSVNHELIRLYWWIGDYIVRSQNQYGWGKSIVDELAKDLSHYFGGTYGFSSRNLWYMRQFYLEYHDKPNLQQLVAEIPWGQNLIILSSKLSDEAKAYYINAVSEFGWTRNVLKIQIKSNAYERSRLLEKQHNFNETLPEHLAEQADDAMKDVYTFDMLGITAPVLEKELELRIVQKVKDIILELGYGFSFIGNQYKVSTRNTDYFIDLLFYHRRLKSLVAIELKTGKFKPEYAGKMNFYLNLLDDTVKEPDENPSIGIILCADKDNVDVEYALRGLTKPVGVSEYILTSTLPETLLDKLPDSTTLKKEIKESMTDIE
jgi:predicted nuclease of restriction endonuclease-like (RecB) superfamily